MISVSYSLSPGFVPWQLRWALVQTDQTTQKKYDFLKKEDQTRLWSLFARKSPRVLVVSPPCTTFSSLQHLRSTEMKPEKRAAGLELLEVGIKACQMRLRSGRTFVFEHPHSAKSWEPPPLCESLAGPSGRDRDHL